jgi:hypothetical protein
VHREVDKLRSRRLVVWLVVTLCVLAELVGLGLVRAQGANALEPPLISSVGLPTDPTRARSAAFMFTSGRAVEFRCTLDRRAPTSCGVGVFGSQTYPGPLESGRHTFEVRAVSRTETSEPASYTWAIVAAPDDTTSDDGLDDDPGEPSGDGSGSGGESHSGPQAPFEISGDVEGLAPGVTKTIALTLRNPNADPIYVTAVTVAISADSSPPGCPSGPNLALGQATGITASSPVVVPGHGSVVLGTYPRAPTISFLNRAWNQDACKAKNFELLYTGSAHS